MGKGLSTCNEGPYEWWTENVKAGERGFIVNTDDAHGKFICLSKDFLNCLQNIFRNHQINFKSIICTNYAKSLLPEEIDNFMEAGSNVLRGYNSNEVLVYPQKPSKMGFFEKLFHIFS